MMRTLVLAMTMSLALAASATSRYVTDRAEAPVRWEEWGKRALERARKEKRPLFVSIGFAASWDAQRMQREAFLNGENAEALNAYFVPVLLDRIEHAEAAEALEAVLLSMRGGSGWPANLILTPDLEPITGARSLTTAELNRMLVIEANRWADERSAVVAEARANLAKAKAVAIAETVADVEAKTMEAVVDDLGATYRRDGALDPKSAAFLFRYAARTQHEPLRQLAVDTLRALAAGPVRDQLGGGFHRCATCFDKLLTDQALLSMAYLDAWQLTKDPDFAHVARTTLDAVIRDLVPPSGLFQSAQDGHSLVPGQGPVLVEGAFYLWTQQEMARLVGEESARKIARLYGMKDGASRLTLAEPRFLRETYDELAEPLAKLLAVRQTRPAPFREIAIAGSNGLMISALARGADALHEPRYLDAATKAATLVATKLWNAPKKTLSRSESGTDALAEDYAMVVQGLLDLFASSSDPKWLELAQELQQRQDQLFWDAKANRYATGRSLPAALQGLIDERESELPGGNAIAATNLRRLAMLTGNAAWRDRPSMIFRAFGGSLRERGALHAGLAAAWEESRMPTSIVVVIGDPRKSETRALLQRERERWDPMRMVLALWPKGVQRDRMAKVLPFSATLSADPRAIVSYVCSDAASAAGCRVSSRIVRGDGTGSAPVAQPF